MRRIPEFRASGLDAKAGPAATEMGLGMASDHTLVKFDDSATEPESCND